MSESILALPAPPADARVSYGPAPQHFGDLRLPPGPGPHPLVIMIHGGFWRNRYDLEHLGHLCADLRARNVATWSLEYRRLGDEGGGWPGTFADIAAGVAFARTLAQTHPLDLERTAILGHSAGGHLALWAACRRSLPPEHPLADGDPLPLRATVSLAGVSDLRAAYEQRLSQRVVAEFLGGSPDEVPERYAAASPIELLPCAVPQILAHGTKDGPVPFQLSADYVAAAQALGDDARLIALEGAHHFELIDPSTPEWATIVAALLNALA